MRMMLHSLQRVLLASLILACASVWSLASADEADSAREVIENLNEQLLENMKQADELGFAGRYKRLAPVIDRAFDLKSIAKLSLGKQWQELDDQQQQQYLDMFRQDTIATYAARFDGFSGEAFKIQDVKDAPRERQQVNTVIVTSDGEQTPINYVLEKGSRDQWQIINVVARGVSDLALKRGQYTSSIKTNGADGFIDQFRAQLKKYPKIPDVPNKSQG